MCKNRLFIASAGSGKTSLIINDVLKNSAEKVLITTFTIANKQSICSRLAAENSGYIPENVTIQTWFSFLIEHGVRPYRFWDSRISGLQLVSTQSGIRYFDKGRPVYWGEKDFNKHYFNSNIDIYSDKLSKLMIRCNETSNGCVILRLEKIFDHIYIDEIQDMAGWDLEIIKLILQSDLKLTMVGDPRQTVYLTHHERKYSKYSYGKIKEFVEVECKKVPCIVDENTLCSSHRNASDICNISSMLYPNYSPCISSLQKTHPHMGLYFVKKSFVSAYSSTFNILQLRLNKKTKLLCSAPAMNFGDSKGLEADHVLIYPTVDMLKWLCGEKIELKDKTKAQLYVALTRAFFSVGVVVDDDFNKTVSNFSIWSAS